MKRYFKAGLLIITLVIPALIFVFLRFVGTNHFDLPYYNPVRNANGSPAVTNGDTVFRTISKIALSARCDGDCGDKLILGGKVTVVREIDNKNSDSAEIASAQFNRLNGLSKNTISELNLLILTSDETFEKIKRAGITKQFSGIVASGDSASVAAIWNDSLGVKYTSLHKSVNAFALIDYRGYVRGYYNGADVEDVDRLMAEIKILKYEKEKQEEQ